MNTIISNIFVIVYAVLTLIVRIMLEQQLQGQYLISIGMGAFALLFLWALIRSGFLKPTILGLDKYGPKKI
jgi:predicted ferric reductase